MNLQILNEKENRLLHRTELDVRMTYSGATPKRAEIINAVAARKNVPEKLIVVDSVNQRFGERVAEAKIKIYESENVMKLVEPRYKLERAKKAMEKQKKEEEEQEKSKEKKEGEKAEGEEKKEGKEEGTKEGE